MKKIQIFSDDEFLLEFNNSNYCIDANTHLEITDIQKEIVLKIYPINQSNLSIPYCAKLELVKNKIDCASKLVKVYNIKDRCDIFIKPFKIYSANVVYNNHHTIKNTRYLISCFEDRIKISSNKGEYNYETNCANCSSSIQGENIYILTKNDSYKTLVCFNTNNSTFYEINGNQIEINENQVKSLKKINDMAKHTVVTTYTIKDFPTQESQELFSEQNQRSSNINELLPYNFFEAVKVKDLNLAKTYLSNKLTSLSNEQICNYFGDFNKIQLTSLSPLIYTLYAEDNAKDYTISINNNKIDEIND